MMGPVPGITGRWAAALLTPLGSFALRLQARHPVCRHAPGEVGTGVPGVWGCMHFISVCACGADGGRM